MNSNKNKKIKIKIYFFCELKFFIYLFTLDESLELLGLEALGELYGLLRALEVGHGNGKGHARWGRACKGGGCRRRGQWAVLGPRYAGDERAASIHHVYA